MYTQLGEKTFQKKKKKVPVVSYLFDFVAIIFGHRWESYTYKSSDACKNMYNNK